MAPAQIQRSMLVHRVAVGIKQHHQCHGPHHQGGRPATAHAAHGGKAQLAVDQHIVAGNIDQQADHTEQQHRASVIHGFRVAAHGQHQGGTGHAPAERIQIATDQRANGRVHVHPHQHRCDAAQDHGTEHPQPQAQPDALLGERVDAMVSFAAEMAGQNRRGTHQHAGHEQKQGHPDAGTHRHCRQIIGTDPTGHHGIHEAIGGLGQLAAENGQGKGELGDELLTTG